MALLLPIIIIVAIAIAIVVVIVESGPPLIRLWGHSPDRDLPLRLDGERFPADFLFELTTAAEFSALMLQNASSKPGRGGRRKFPFAFQRLTALAVALGRAWWQMH